MSNYYEGTEGKRFLTKYRSAEQVLEVHGATHIQVHDSMIVPKIMIRDIFVNMGIIEFNDGSAEYFSSDYVGDLTSYYYTERPYCGCGIPYKDINKYDQSTWICQHCMTEQVIETYGTEKETQRE